MRPSDDHQDAASELRVTDKRRFTVDGDIRDEAAGASEPAESQPAPPASPASAAPTGSSSPATDGAPRIGGEGAAPPAAGEGAAPSGGEAARGPAFDLGIEAVFYVFYQSAMIALGAAHPGETARVDLAEARQAIEFLKILEHKTAGNLTPQEAATVRELMDDAQMTFVRVARGVTGVGA